MLPEHKLVMELIFSHVPLGESGGARVPGNEPQEKRVVKQPEWHQPSGGVGGTAADIKVQAKEIIYLKKLLHDIMAECTGQTIEKIEIDSDRDFYMSPEEAKEYGLIDEVVSLKKK